MLISYSDIAYYHCRPCAFALYSRIPTSRPVVFKITQNTLILSHFKLLPQLAEIYVVISLKPGPFCISVMAYFCCCINSGLPITDLCLLLFCFPRLFLFQITM